MEIAKLFESFFECSEAYKIVDRLKQTVLNQSEKNHFFEYLVSNNVDLKIDFLRDLFQSKHGDRDKFKQDFTPDSIAQIIASQMTDSGSVADICSGTGTLLIQILNKFPDAFLHAEELSDRAIPFLLTNLTIRNAEAEVLHLDVLTKELKAVYRLSKGERFSTITVSSDEPEFRTFDFVVMNPPYSVKWTPVKSEENKAFGLAPKSYADFQFVLHGLHHLRDAAKLIAVLPHGVLFRGNGEKTVRENLIRAGLLEYVVGLPDKLFLNTSIPVCLLGLSKQNNRGTLFVDASKSFKKRSKQNEMLDEHVQLVIEAIRCRNSTQGFSKLVSTNELEENDFNLNIPRYVDRLEQEEPVDFANSVRELVQIDDEIKQTEKELLGQIKKLTGFSYEEVMEINKWEKQLLGRSRSAPRSKEQKKDNSTQLELF